MVIASAGFLQFCAEYALKQPSVDIRWVVCVGGGFDVPRGGHIGFRVVLDSFKEDWLLTACHPGKDRVTEVSPGCRLTKDLMNNDWLRSDQRLIVWTFQSTHPVWDATALQQSPCAARACKRFGANLPGKSCALGVRTEVRVIHERLIRRFGGSFGSWPANGNGSPFLLVEIVLPSDDVETLGF